jgi:hypothetical protein
MVTAEGHVLACLQPADVRAAAAAPSHDAVIRVYDAAGDVIETHEHKGDFKEP